MPIEARTPKECFEALRGHLATLTAATIDTHHPLAIVNGATETTAMLGFRQGNNPITIPVQTTAHGTLHFYLSQNLFAKQLAKKRYRLETHFYAYRLQMKPGMKEQAVVRWEYEKAASRDSYPRNHVHFSAAHDTGSVVFDFDKLHTPTGWVTIESVLRFIIADLGHVAPSRDWSSLLNKSEVTFRTKFIG